MTKRHIARGKVEYAGKGWCGADTSGWHCRNCLNKIKKVIDLEWEWDK